MRLLADEGRVVVGFEFFAAVDEVGLETGVELCAHRIDDGVVSLVVYTLDISSLGAEKPIALEKLANYDGRYVHLHLSHPVQGENILEGTLKVVDEETLGLTFFIKGRKKDVTFPKKDVDSARLAIKF